MTRTDSISFNGGGAFSTELKALGRDHVSDRRRARRAQTHMYAKTVAMIGWAAASWALLMFFSIAMAADSFWLIVLLRQRGMAIPAVIGYNRFSARAEVLMSRYSTLAGVASLSM